MKKAHRVELYDAGILIGTEGIFDEFGQLEIFEANPFQIEKFAKIFDIPYGTYPEVFYNKKKEKEEVRQVGLGHLELTINRILRHTEWQLSEIWAEIVPAGLLDLVLVQKDGYRNKITYSGRFAVEWEEES